MEYPLPSSAYALPGAQILEPERMVRHPTLRGDDDVFLAVQAMEAYERGKRVDGGVVLSRRWLHRWRIRADCSSSECCAAGAVDPLEIICRNRQTDTRHRRLRTVAA